MCRWSFPRLFTTQFTQCTGTRGQICGPRDIHISSVPIKIVLFCILTFSYTVLSRRTSDSDARGWNVVITAIKRMQVFALTRAINIIGIFA